jgi:preprotein translocase subunit YajC
MDPLTLVMLGILALLIFFMFRNSRKRKAELAMLQEKMVPGAEVMTNFGLFGTLVAVDEDTNVATIETSPGSTVRVHRQTLARVVEDEPVVDEVDDAAVEETPGAVINESSLDAPPKKSKRSPASDD